MRISPEIHRTLMIIGLPPTTVSVQMGQGVVMALLAIRAIIELAKLNPVALRDTALP